MAGRVKVRFTRTVTYETGGVGIGPVYEAGSVHELRPDIAERWIRRNAAVPVVDKPELTSPAPAVASVAAETRAAPATSFDRPSTAGRRGRRGA